MLSPGLSSTIITGSSGSSGSGQVYGSSVVVLVPVVVPFVEVVLVSVPVAVEFPPVVSVEFPSSIGLSGYSSGTLLSGLNGSIQPGG